MTAIAKKALVLAVNRNQRPIGYRTVGKAFKSMCQMLKGQTEPALAFDIGYTGEQPYIEGVYSWEKWITLPVREKDLSIMTSRGPIRVPEVIMEPSYNEMPMITPRRSRKAILSRDGYVCQYCNTRFEEPLLNLDHVIPRDLGGRTAWENLVCSCIKCNSKKANRLPHDAGMQLLRRPKTPHRMPICTALKDVRRPGWRLFMFL